MKWLTGNLAVLNVVLVFFSIIGYLATIYWIAWVSVFPYMDSARALRVGVVIDYRWLGQIVIYSIVDGNLVPYFSFPDFTSYFLAALALLNGIALTVFFFKTPADEDPRTTHAWKLALRNLVLTIACVAAFVYIMSFINTTLKNISVGDVGGIIGAYFPSFLIRLNPVGPYGYPESFPDPFILDFPLWLLLLLLLSTIITIRRQIRDQPPVKPSPETQT